MLVAAHVDAQRRHKGHVLVQVDAVDLDHQQLEVGKIARHPFLQPRPARYTHRAAIASSRLVAVNDDAVSFTYKDYRRNGRQKIMRLEPDEFIRRFLLHVLPNGYHRIRHYGLLARGDRNERLELCGKLAATSHLAEPSAPDCPDQPAADSFAPNSFTALLCPDCGALMRRIGVVSPVSPRPFHCDTS